MAKLYIDPIDGFPFMHVGSGGHEPLGVPRWLKKLVQLWHEYDSPEDSMLADVLLDVVAKRIEQSPARDRLIAYFKR